MIWHSLQRKLCNFDCLTMNYEPGVHFISLGDFDTLRFLTLCRSLHRLCARSNFYLGGSGRVRGLRMCHPPYHPPRFSRQIYNFCHPALLKIRSKTTVNPSNPIKATSKLPCSNKLQLPVDLDLAFRLQVFVTHDNLFHQNIIFLFPLSLILEPLIWGKSMLTFLGKL